MNDARRYFLQAVSHTAVAGLALGLIGPGRVLAATERRGFDAISVNDALRGIDAAAASDTRDIVLRVPDVADNAASVPMDIVSNLPNTESISVLVDKNPHPLAARFNFSPGVLPQVHVRVKMAQTSNIRVVVRAGGKTWQIAREVKVTLGGCGA